MGLGKPAPNLRLLDLVSVLQTMIDGYDVFNEDIDSHRVLFVFLVDCQGLFIQAVLSGDAGNVGSIIVLDVANNLAFICPNGSKQQKVL